MNKKCLFLWPNTSRRTSHIGATYPHIRHIIYALIFATLCTSGTSQVYNHTNKSVTGSSSFSFTKPPIKSAHSPKETEDSTIFIVIPIHPYNKIPYLPYLFGSLESQIYDNKRIKLRLITERLSQPRVSENEGESSSTKTKKFQVQDSESFWNDPKFEDNERTLNILKYWIAQNRHKYADVDLIIGDQILEDRDFEPNSGSQGDDEGEDYWNDTRFERIINIKNRELNLARGSWADFVLFMDADVILVNKYTFKNLTTTFSTQPEMLVLAPLLNSFDSYSNFWGAMDSSGYYKRSENYLTILHRKSMGLFQVPMVFGCFMIDLRKKLSQTLTFDPRNLDIETPLDDLIAFSKSAKLSFIDFHLDNRELYGYFPNSMPEKEHSFDDTVQTLVDLEQVCLKEGPPFAISQVLEQLVEPLVYFPDMLGVDQIYIINLERRPQRKERMERVLKLQGIKAKYWAATDGKKLNQSYLDRFEIKSLPGYQDPYHKRNITFGEIGCFLSHYRIWEDALRNNYSKIIILEDDAEFVRDFRAKWHRTLENFKALEEFYDFLYLGRKLGNTHMEELKVGHGFVEPHYSYWTVAYMLTGSGIQKLLHSNPLRRLLPVDEFLPVMFGVHSDESLVEAFESHGPFTKVNSLSTNPLLVFPTHYVGDALYISDTEDKKSASSSEQNSEISEKQRKSSQMEMEPNDGQFEYVDEEEEDRGQLDATPVLFPPPDSNSISHFEL